LYTEADARAALRQFAPVPTDRNVAIDGAQLQLHPAGHILGACMASITTSAGTLLFSGDLGRPNDPIMVAPARVRHADWLVLESTYGNRQHGSEDPIARLGKAIGRTAARGGVVLIPSFAVGRAQSLLHAIHQLKARGDIPAGLPVYLNSPMAADVTAIYRKHRETHRLTAPSAPPCAARRRW
jgi:metallo-beta-lactamase family protein